MAAKSFRVSFTLDESDIAYFRNIIRTAKKNASVDDRSKIVRGARKLIDEVRAAERTPSFVLDAISALEDLIEMIDDEDWAMTDSEQQRVLAALGYFAEQQDVVPDHVPALGFLDDAIMIRLVEDDFQPELWGYRRFRKFREGAEQRPWTRVARERLPGRLKEKRAELRKKIADRRKKTGARAW
ncbi:MAG: YkvA family protein [Myxococcota bacterium]|nr:YkvA family protein [Myxococcota bacterium]